MAFQPLSPAAERRITLLAILPAVGGDLDAALTIFDAISEDGRFFDAEGSTRPTEIRSARPSGTSRPQASSSRPSNRGRDQRQPFTGQMSNPDGPPTEKQIGLVLKNTDDYTEDELWDMTKQQVSDLIQDLIG